MIFKENFRKNIHIEERKLMVSNELVYEYLKTKDFCAILNSKMPLLVWLAHRLSH